MYHRVPIKPLSVNSGYKGRRFLTAEHKRWSKSVKFLLPKTIQLPKTKFYSISYIFGVSNTNSDGENLQKFCTDEIAKRYKFNDRIIRKGSWETEIVKKGQEFFSFKIEPYG